MVRLETGPYRPAPDDWTGLFLRGDDAVGFAYGLKSYMADPNDPIYTAMVRSLIDLLESCRE